ncbi:predicted protein [Chaetomium globosum CBS 148.51]|uniref:Uncharacterized protein n=1 Tax=Chaetomium globosum (strain ATCC 6205 / CBS 148.51 / DSM 1962 / NBRC 6347 / NRRL 1970) TaxID=306901 RepID=Q2GWA5_CHAGB|nr:uncharacterized protein CHGG_07749 [Chaetomium globosum CBS 148.51]EAQ86496.1 predicted protein [Chaetomium globosum CBS 148.51]
MSPLDNGSVQHHITLSRKIIPYLQMSVSFANILGKKFGTPSTSVANKGTAGPGVLFPLPQLADTFYLYGAMNIASMANQGRGRGRGNHNNNNNRNGNGNGNGHGNGNRSNRSGNGNGNGNRNWDDNSSRHRNGDRNNGWNNSRGISKAGRYNNNGGSSRGRPRSASPKTLKTLVLDTLRAPADAIDPKPFIELSVATSLAGGLLIDTLVQLDFTNREIARTLAVPLSNLLQLHSITRLLIDGNREPDAEGDHPMFDSDAEEPVEYGQRTNRLARGDGQNGQNGQNGRSNISENQLALAKFIASDIGVV